MNFKDTINKIKNQYNIVDYIRANGIDLENAGNGSWKGLCPFHNEKTPSFTVSEDFQTYKCFGCGESGDILSFVEHTHTISFYEAVKMLAEEKGIEIKDNKDSAPAHDINGVRKVLKDADKFFRHSFSKLNESHPAKKEITKRGLSVDNKLFGYSLEAPNHLYKFLKKRGHSDKNIKDSQLVMFFEDNRDPWDFFHGRLMITLSDYLGRPVSFTSRKIYDDDRMQAKYINGKESPVFHKKNNLFGSHIAKKKARSEGVIYVVEGQFDQIAMTENGVSNVVATSGTAFTEDHANILLRMIGDNGRVVFIMDGDSAGIKAAMKIFKTVPELHTNSYAVLLSKGKDPCAYIEEGGIESLLERIDKQVPLYDFIIDVLKKQLGNKITSNNRQQFVSEVAKYAKHSNKQHIIDSMLNKASILSAISIDNVNKIYNDVDVNKKYLRKKEKAKEKELNPLLKLNKNNEADVCMFSAIALLVRLPEELVPETPKRIHKKFRPFLKEFSQEYKKAKKNGGKMRFIAESYTDIDFAKALQNKKFLENPKNDIESSKVQYKFLFERANTIYREERKKAERAKALSSISGVTDPQKIAEVLRTYKESQS